MKSMEDEEISRELFSDPYALIDFIKSDMICDMRKWVDGEMCDRHDSYISVGFLIGKIDELKKNLMKAQMDWLKEKHGR